MNIDLMREDPPHYVVSPSNEYEERMLAALYEFHRSNPILLDEKPKAPPRLGPRIRTDLCTGKDTLLT